MSERIMVTLIARRRTVLVVLAAVLLAALIPAALVTNRVSNGGYLTAGSQSARVFDVLGSRFHAGSPNVVVLVETHGASVDDAAVTARGRRLTAVVRGTPGIVEAESYWSSGDLGVLRSAAGTSALVLAHAGGGEDARQKTAARVAERVAAADKVDRVRVTGQAELQHQVNVEAKLDLARAEVFAGPLVLLLLLLIMRSAVGVLLTAALSLTVLVVSSASIYLTTLVVPNVSVFALNMASTLGLGLSIDYSLFVISRFREELDTGCSSQQAALRTGRTAGRAVIFSAGTVALAQAVLLIFPVPVMRSFAYGGIPAALFAGVFANVLLIPVLAGLGTRIDRLGLPRKRRARAAEDPWYRLAWKVMGAPVPVIAVILLVLALVASPFRHLRLGNVDQSTLPPGNSARAALDAIEAKYHSNEVAAFPVVALGTSSAEMSRTAARISALGSVARVDTVSGSWSAGHLVAPPSTLSGRFSSEAGTWASIVPRVGWVSPAALRLVRTLRGYRSPRLMVGGIAAETIDSNAAVTGRVPLALALIAITMFLLLMAMFRSVLVPAKAIVLNLLSLSATMGALVWVFQEGHLAGAIGYTPTGSLWSVAPVLIFCVAFGLSMDYEVFLLSRIREEVDAGSSNEEAIAQGLRRSARIITSASVLISVVFLGLLSAHVGIMKILGLGLALAVLMDATLIRGALVPAIMKLAGGANWWLPRALGFLERPSPTRDASSRPSAGLAGALAETGATETLTEASLAGTFAEGEEYG
jgi:putative drug exporter of the RND superfamily